MTKVILTVLTLAFGMRPRELARRDSASGSATVVAFETAEAFDTVALRRREPRLPPFFLFLLFRLEELPLLGNKGPFTEEFRLPFLAKADDDEEVGSDFPLIFRFVLTRISLTTEPLLWFSPILR